MAYEGDGQFDAAIADASKAMALDEKLAPASLLIMASAKLKKSDLNGALADVDKAIALDAKNTTAFQIRAV